MARRVSKKAWDNYTKRLEAQRLEAYNDAYEWVMRHGSAANTRKMMVEASIYHGRSVATKSSGGVQFEPETNFPFM